MALSPRANGLFSRESDGLRDSEELCAARFPAAGYRSICQTVRLCPRFYPTPRKACHSRVCQIPAGAAARPIVPLQKEFAVRCSSCAHNGLILKERFLTIRMNLRGAYPQMSKQNHIKACMLAYAFYETDNRIRRYAEALVKRGDEVEAIVLGRKGQPTEEIIKGVRVLRIQKRERDERRPISYLLKILMFFVRSAWVLTTRHLRSRYDVIHVHSVPDFQVFATLVPRLLGARVILDIHDIVPEFYASKFKVGERSVAFRMLLLVEKLSCAYASHVIISNHLWHKKLTGRSVRAEKCTPIINYPDPEIFSPRSLPNERKEFVICYPGTLNWHQGVDLAVGAMALLREKIPNLRLLIIGDGPERDKLQAMVKRESLEDRVSLSRMIPLEQVAEVMAEVDLGVVPKRRHSFGNEAFSTKILEFMAMGVPVLASKTRIDEWYFGKGQVQFFESENVEDLAVQILSLVKNTESRRILQARGAEFIEKNNWDAKKHEYLDLTDQLIYRRTAFA
jgi:glycosyltransferase involved in cell wall biosynthesis